MNRFTYRMLLERLQCMSSENLDSEVCVLNGCQILHVRKMSCLGLQSDIDAFDVLTLVHNTQEPLLVI